METCLFCRIARQEIPAKIVMQNDDVTAFEDVNPQAPTHILVIPNTHVETLNDIEEEHQLMLGKMVHAAIEIAKDRKISSSGYRLVWNTNRGAGQSVFHIHLHLLGGRTMAWPPG